MPSEFRHIVFRAEEVVQAIQSYMRRMNQPLPAGSILACSVEPDGMAGSVRFRITLAPDGINNRKLNRTERRDVIVEGPSLAAALILHCQALRIPLPAKAAKSLRLVGGQLCLLAAIQPKEHAVDPRLLSF